MRKLLLLALAVCGLMGAEARPQGHLGYRRGRMSWSHLGPRPESATSTRTTKQGSLTGAIEKKTYPAKFDLRDEKAVSAVKAQSPFGCCWAFAACGSLESFLMRKLGVEYDFSERNLALFWGGDYDPDLDVCGYGLIDQGGDTAPADAYFLRWAGPVAETKDPFPEGDAPALTALREKYGDFFRNTLSKVMAYGDLYFWDAEVTLEYLSGLDFDDWTIIDREANKAGFGVNFRTNFIHSVKVVDDYGRKVSIPHLNRNLIRDEGFADCPDRQGPWEVPFHVQGCWRLPPRTSSLDNATYKYALINQGAISAAYHQDMKYRLVATNEGVEVVSYYCPQKGKPVNHQILIVGWDDDFPASSFVTAAPGNGAFLIKNSWGADDEAGGFFWVSYYDMELARAKGDVASVYSRVDDPYAPENYDYIHSYDTLGLCGSYGFKKTSATAANMFSAPRAESLRAIGTYLLQWNTKYTVRIYTGCTAGKPTSGVLVHTQTGTREFPGYETIDLDTEVPVAAGERYSVVVTFTTPDFKTPIPVQVDDTKGSRYSKKKRSYVRNTSGAWVDIVAAYNSKKPLSASNSPKTFCCKVYADARETTTFDGDAKGIYTVKLADGSVLTVTVGTSSGGRCSVSAKIVKSGKTVATYSARSMSVDDGFVILKSSKGKDLWLTLAGDEMGGNVLTASMGGVELTGIKAVNPNVTGYEVGAFRVGVAVVGAPVFTNATGKALTWSAKNLPAGVKINAKTGRLVGSPTAVVKTAKTARIYATATGGGADSYAFEYTVDGLHGWAQGTKTGGGEASAFTFTVGKTGKVSGKLFLVNTNWTFSASCLNSYHGEDGLTNYFFSGSAVSGKMRLPLEVVISPSVLTNCTTDVSVTTIGVAEGMTAGGDVFSAQTSVWGCAPYVSYAKVLANAPALKIRYGELSGLHEAESLSLRFGKSGTVIAAGSFKGVKSGKSVDYKPSRTIPLVPRSTGEDGEFHAVVYPWFSPSSTYRFKGFAEQIPLLWDHFRFIRD